MRVGGGEEREERGGTETEREGEKDRGKGGKEGGRMNITGN